MISEQENDDENHLMNYITIPVHLKKSILNHVLMSEEQDGMLN